MSGIVCSCCVSTGEVKVLFLLAEAQVDREMNKQARV